MSGDTPRCTVVRVLEMRGPKGGLIYVLALSCKGWMTWRPTRKRPNPPTEVSCVGCFVKKTLEEEDGRGA